MFELSQLSAFHFLRPWWLLAFIPLVLCVLYLVRLRDPVAQWDKTIAPHLLKALVVSGGARHWFNPVSFSLLAIVLAVVALAGPSWERRASPFVEDEAALVIVLDLSETMNQTDTQPSRMERAKQKIEDLLKLRGGARTGLVVFSGSAHSVVPLTNDPEIFKNYLGALATGMMPRAGKFPEKALPLADRMLRDSDVPGSVLLIGDGLGADSAAVFMNYFQGVQHQLLVLGVGLESAPEASSDDPQFGGAHLPLQRDELTSLASDNGGRYQNLSIDNSDVQRINRLINHHLANVDAADRPWVDAGYYLIYPFALIFLFWFRKGWTLQWCLVLAVVSTVSYQPNAIAVEEIPEQATTLVEGAAGRWFMDLWLTPDQQGRYYFERGDYSTAATRFRDPGWKGIAFYYAENFAAAEELFSRVDTTDGLFNMANAQAQGQHYVRAVKTYTRVLERDPEHAGAIKNRARLQAIIDDINRLSESQRAEQGESSRNLGDAPQRAEGAEREAMGPREIEQLSADDILADQRVQEMWMRQIQQDPSRFLGAKFHMQLNRDQASE